MRRLWLRMDILIAAAVVLLVVLLVLGWMILVAGPLLLLLLKIGAGLLVLCIVGAIIMAAVDPEGFKKAQAQADEQQRLRNAPAERARQEWSSRPKRPR